MLVVDYRFSYRTSILRFLLLSTLLFVVFLFTVPTNALSPVEAIINGAEKHDELGTAVAVSNDTVVIGIPKSDIGFIDAGEGQVWIRNGTTWSLQHSIPGTAKSDHLGESIAIDADTLVIGAPLADEGSFSNAGEVQIWIRSGTNWSLQQRIAGNAKDMRFGRVVSISGDTLIVGSPDAKVNGLKSGRVDVYTRSNGIWTLEQTMLGIAMNDRYGDSVDINADTLVIGAPRVDVNGLKNAGEAQVWTRATSTWTIQQVFSGANKDDELGTAVAIDLDTLVIGVPMVDVNGLNNAGESQVWKYSGGVWSLQQTISGLREKDKLGSSVALDGDLIAVGAPDAELNGLNEAGEVQIWLLSGNMWFLEDIISGDDKNINLGYSVGLSGDILVVGTPQADPSGLKGAGQAHIYSGVAVNERQGCFIDAPQFVPVNTTITVLFRCEEVTDVYGFEFNHSSIGGGIQPLSNIYLSGDVFASSGNNNFTLINDIDQGYGVSLRHPEQPVTGDVILAIAQYDSTITGTVNFVLDSLTLGNIQGQAIPNIIAPNSDAQVIIFDPNA